MKPHSITVADLMSTALITVHPDETVRDAHLDMQQGAIRHLPVVDTRGKLVGIVSDRDLLRALNRSKSITIAEVMTRDVVTVTGETSAHLACKLMLERTISALPVIGEGGQMVGLVTVTDLVEVARRALLGLPLDGSS